MAIATGKSMYASEGKVERFERCSSASLAGGWLVVSHFWRGIRDVAMGTKASDWPSRQRIVVLTCAGQ